MNGVEEVIDHILVVFLFLRLGLRRLRLRHAGRRCACKKPSPSRSSQAIPAITDPADHCSADCPADCELDGCTCSGALSLQIPPTIVDSVDLPPTVVDTAAAAECLLVGVLRRRSLLSLV